MAALSWAAYFADLAHCNVWATDRLPAALAGMTESDDHRGQTAAALTHMVHGLQQKKAPASE